MTTRPTSAALRRSHRRGETYLRQGLLGSAIAEFVAAVEADPGDWFAVGRLGDLFLRAGDIARAVEHYARIGDAFHARGGLSLAAAAYKRILTLTPQAEPIRLKVADIWIAQGKLADAKKILGPMAASRARNGDQPGAAAILRQIADLDPEDLSAGLAAALATAETGDRAAASGRLLAVSERFRGLGELAQSLRALDMAARLDPQNAAITGPLVAFCLEAGDLDRAAEHASSAAEFKAIAAAWAAGGHAGQALAAIMRALECDPADRQLRLEAVQEAMRGGAFDVARGCVPEDCPDAAVLLCLLEVELQSGSAAAARHAAERTIRADAARWSAMAELSLRFSGQARDAAFEVVDVATDRAIVEREWAAAATALQAFASRVPPHVPSLMKLVEVCVDGALAERLAEAQAGLADAYLASGQAAEARVIAEDLVSADRSSAAHLERLRRALVLLGEPDPDACIAARFDPEPLNALFGDAADVPAAVPAPPPVVAAPPAAREQARPRTAGRDQARPAGTPPGRERQSSGVEHYRNALVLCRAGRLDEAVAELEHAVRSPRYRFESARLLAKLHRDRGDLSSAIDWLERATHGAPGPEALHEVLYELGTVLLAAGEGERALAVFLELQAEDPGYKDVSRRVLRLSPRGARS